MFSIAVPPIKCHLQCQPPRMAQVPVPLPQTSWVPAGNLGKAGKMVHGLEASNPHGRSGFAQARNSGSELADERSLSFVSPSLYLCLSE